MKNNILIAVLFLAFSMSLSAQKYGHINSQALLLQMPEIAIADSNIESYQKELTTKGEKMVTAFDAAYSATLEKVNNQDLSPILVQAEEAKLAEQQQKIQAFQQEVQQLLYQRREELYQPVFTKVDDAIKAVGKAEAYTMVFDTSVGAILFTDDSEDLTDKVKAKLGL